VSPHAIGTSRSALPSGSSARACSTTACQAAGHEAPLPLLGKAIPVAPELSLRHPKSRLPPSSTAPQSPSGSIRRETSASYGPVATRPGSSSNRLTNGAKTG
jgi:hypothetical protein